MRIYVIYVDRELCEVSTVYTSDRSDPRFMTYNRPFITSCLSRPSAWPVHPQENHTPPTSSSRLFRLSCRALPRAPTGFIEGSAFRPYLAVRVRTYGPSTLRPTRLPEQTAKLDNILHKRPQLLLTQGMSFLDLLYCACGDSCWWYWW